MTTAPRPLPVDEVVIRRADPFAPTADLVTLLRVRAAALHAPAAARAATSFRRRLALARG